MPDPTDAPAAAADTFFLSRQPNRLETDHGPIYKETPADPLAPNSPAIAEPWNTVTAALFVFLAGYWLVKLRGRLAGSPFVAVCMPILLAGGVGGTLYHATRTRFVYFLLDVIPISLLGIAGAVYLIVRLGKAMSAARLAAVGLGAVAAYLFLNGVIFRVLLAGEMRARPTLAVNLSYASLALVVLVPLGAVLVRTRFRHYGLILAALLSFAVAWLARLLDDPAMTFPPMGTHWVWHTFGAIPTAALIAYFHRLEREAV